MHRTLFYLLLFLLSPLCSNPTEWETENDEEALFLRRIADFWEEGEYQIVKGQIEEFLQLYPKSAFFQTLSATLGDLYLRENNFKTALLHYSHIEDPAIAQRIFFNRMQCLLELQWYATLADECEVFLKSNTDPEKKIRASYLLAVSLYQQCINLPADSEDLALLVKRAIPHFQFLLEKSDVSQEIAPAYAHLCCMLKDFETASSVYMQLAEGHENEEELLFQAALLQAKVDRPHAIQMFRSIEKMEGNRAADATYNRLVLMVDLGTYEEVLQEKEEFLSLIPSERRETAHLLFGHCYLQLRRCAEAIDELSFIMESQSEPSELFRSAYIDLIEAAYLVNDESFLVKILDRFSRLFPNDSQLSKGIVAHAILLKDQKRFAEASDRLRALLSSTGQFPERERALFELIQLDFHEQRWKECAESCREYLINYPNAELLHSVGRFLAASSSHLNLPEVYLANLEMLLSIEGFTDQEMHDWRFLFAKACYDCGYYSQAIDTLETFFIADSSSAHHADAHLLLGLCYRDGDLYDLERFCEEATEGLNLGAELFEHGAIHIALFNAYLDLKKIDSAAEHLYLASKSRELETDHLLWLADYYYDESSRTKTFELYVRATELLEKFIARSEISAPKLAESLLFFEPILVKLAELSGYVGREFRQKEILEGLKEQRTEHPSWAWMHEDKADLLLAECYMKMNREEEAFALFEAINSRGRSIRNNVVTASACLQSARLQITRWIKKRSGSPVKILTQLKNLVLQRTLANEPIHLEAALEYIDLRVLQEGKSVEKRLSLLNKTKTDFEMGEDLLSLDYQKSRKNFPEQDQIYRTYMQLFDAEILLCEAELASDRSERNVFKLRAIDQLKKILSSPITSFLKKRVEEHLSQFDDEK